MLLIALGVCPSLLGRGLSGALPPSCSEDARTRRRGQFHPPPGVRVEIFRTTGRSAAAEMAPSLLLILLFLITTTTVVTAPPPLGQDEGLLLNVIAPFYKEYAGAAGLLAAMLAQTDPRWTLTFVTDGPDPRLGSGVFIYAGANSPKSAIYVHVLLMAPGWSPWSIQSSPRT